MLTYVTIDDSNGFFIDFSSFVYFFVEADDVFRNLVSQMVNKQKLSHLMEQNEKLEKQLKQRKMLINDQLTKIAKQVGGQTHQ